MMSSIILKKDSTDIVFTKIEVNILSGKTTVNDVEYELRGEILNHVENKHRIFLPCKIKTDKDFEMVAFTATLYVPVSWHAEIIENYTQALLDELYLYKHGITGCKSIKQIEQSFMLEIIVL